MNAKTDLAVAERTCKFFVACIGGSSEKSVLSLVDDGIDVELVGIRGYRPLHLAARRGMTRVIDKLLKEGADVDGRMSVAWTPLHVAAKAGQISAAELLVSRGANINERTSNFETALLLSARKFYEELSNFLLNRGANVWAEDGAGSFPAGTEFLRRLKPIGAWQDRYERFCKTGTPFRSAKELYRLLAVYPLVSPCDSIKRADQLRTLFSHAKFAVADDARILIEELARDGLDAATAASLNTIVG